MDHNLIMVDHARLRANQAMIIVLNLLAFVTNLPTLVLFVTLVMIIGSLMRQPGFSWVYAGLLKPLGLVKPELLEDNPEPHLFAQGFGAVVMTLSMALFWIGLPAAAWVMVWLVNILAVLNLFVGFCVGCAIYYWLQRLHVPGFVKQPPEGTMPGMRPKAGNQ